MVRVDRWRGDPFHEDPDDPTPGVSARLDLMEVTAAEVRVGDIVCAIDHPGKSVWRPHVRILAIIEDQGIDGHERVLLQTASVAAGDGSTGGQGRVSTWTFAVEDILVVVNAVTAADPFADDGVWVFAIR